MRKNIVIEIKQKLKELIPVTRLKFIIEPRIDHIESDFTAEFYINNHKIKVIGEIIEKESSSVFYKRISQLKLYEKQNPEYVPLLVARYFSSKKQEYCKENNINYLDLSGNVYLNYPNVYIEKTGFANKFPEKREGRNPFSDKASLLLRLMLEGNKVWGVREIAERAGLNSGFVSRMFKELEQQNYLIKRDRKSKLINKRNLLRDWVDFYDYKKNKESRYFCLSKGPEEIISRLSKSNIANEINYALSFQSGAYLVSPHAVFNEVHLYVSDLESVDLFTDLLELREVERGANFFILDPYYRKSVFFKKQRVKNLWVVSDIQLYIDLYKYPQRGLEQAEHLYEKRLKKMIEIS